MSFETQFSFELPRGYLDKDGNLHRNGMMRLATAADEIIPLKDPRVQQNPSYLSIILLARVIVKLGELPAIDTVVIERMFTADLAYLQDLYQRINQAEPPTLDVQCPHCGQHHEVALLSQGEY